MYTKFYGFSEPPFNLTPNPRFYYSSAKHVTIDNKSFFVGALARINNLKISKEVMDVLDENNETVILTIGTPTNASKGATDVHTVTINDNDDPNNLNISGFKFDELDGTIQNILIPLKQAVEANGENLYINLTYVSFTDQIYHQSCSGMPYRQYIHNNPVRASLVQTAQDYPWSSFFVYHDTKNDMIEGKLELDKYGTLPSEATETYFSFPEI